MSNLALRALSALVLLPVVGALILWHEPLGFGALVVLVSGLALHECAAIMLAGASPKFRAMVVALGVALHRRPLPRRRPTRWSGRSARWWRPRR